MMKQLPLGWVSATLGEIGVWSSGGTPKATNAAYYGGSIPWAVIGDLNDGRVDVTASTITDSGLRESSAKVVPEGSILLAMYGSIGKLGIAGRPMATNQAIAAVRPLEPVDARYLFWYLRSQRSALAGAGRGGTQANVSQTILKAWPIPVAPVGEQRRIVSAIDEQISRLEEAVGLIRSGLARLPLVRRAVLGEVMPDPLPEGWKLLTVEEAGTVELGRQRSPQYHSGPNMKPYLRVANVHEDRIDLGDVKEMDFPPQQLARYELRPGDILLNEGQSPEFVGRPAMYHGELPGVCFTNSLIRFRPFNFVDGEYALLVFLRHLRFGRFEREAQITTNIAHMAAGRFKKVEFPVPPMDEQREIVQEVRRQLSLLSAFESELRIALRRSDTLRAAILAAAFRGELVPQDPSDEPATKLLARITADRPPPARRTRKTNGD
jgi:type I restriction enzyme S subunit